LGPTNRRTVSDERARDEKRVELRTGGKGGERTDNRFFRREKVDDVGDYIEKRK
jgi:hypothetical protein